MLPSQAISNALAQNFNSSQIQIVAIIDTKGVVLQSYERHQNDTEIASPNQENMVYSQYTDDDDRYAVNLKLQTKMLAMFASELWKQNSTAVWTGAEIKKLRLVVHELNDKQLLILLVARNKHSWELISSTAAKVAQDANRVLAG